LSVSINGNFVKISIETPDTDTRIPNDICCVLDISGSMGAEAQVKNAKGIKE